MKTIAFFNNKGGVGKTTLVYHLAWMYAELGVPVLAVDLDPQANLTGMFVGEERLEELWPEGGRRRTIFGALTPLFEGTGDIVEPHCEELDQRLGLIPGDLFLSGTEDELNAQWPKCLTSGTQSRAFRVISSLWRAIELAAVRRNAGIVLIDVGPNLGAINRAALLCAQHVVLPLAPDLYSLQGMRNLGPTLRKWRADWGMMLNVRPDRELSVPGGEMQPSGYTVMQHMEKLKRPVKAYDRWMQRIPETYREFVLGETYPPAPASVAGDPECLAALKHYRSLMPLAQEARKPMFHLRSADGAIGSHAQAVKNCHDDFRNLALKIAERTGIALPDQPGAGLFP